MSRSGYSDDCSGADLVMWRGAVASAVNGKRGQAFLRELLAALDSMPEKRLIAGHLEEDGEFCAIGTVGAVRGVDMTKLDVCDDKGVAKAFGIAPALVKEIEFMNDDDFDYSSRETPEARWMRVRAWVASEINPESAP